MGRHQGAAGGRRSCTLRSKTKSCSALQSCLQTMRTEDALKCLGVAGRADVCPVSPRRPAIFASPRRCPPASSMPRPPQPEPVQYYGIPQHGGGYPQQPQYGGQQYGGPQQYQQPQYGGPPQVGPSSPWPICQPARARALTRPPTAGPILPAPAGRVPAGPGAVLPAPAGPTAGLCAAAATQVGRWRRRERVPRLVR